MIAAVCCVQIIPRYIIKKIIPAIKKENLLSGSPVLISVY